MPVVSSLSTARTSLSGDGDWFFRTIAPDRRCLQTFVDTARARGLPIHTSVAIYEESDYGRGPLEFPIGLLGDLVQSVDPAHAFRRTDVFGAPGHQVG